MKSKIVELEVNVDNKKLWDILTDIDNLSYWIPTIVDVSISEKINIGVGTTYTTSAYTRSKAESGPRHVISKTSSEIVSFNKYESLTTNLVEGLGVMKSFQIEWLMKSSGNSTWVSVTPTYKMRFGFIGSLLDKFIVGRAIRTEFGRILSNLKHFAETGEKIPKPSWMPKEQSMEHEKIQTSVSMQSDAKSSSQITTSKQTSEMFSTETNISNQYCKKCYGGLNEKGKCNQCDKKW